MDIKTVMIIDDESAARQNLRSVIDNYCELKVIAEIRDGKTAISEIQRLKPDVVFLDIEMPKTNGFDVATATQGENYQLVFVTAYEQYALNAFDTKAIDYLLKPVRPELLEKCINKILYQECLALEALEKQKTDTENIVLSDASSFRVLKHSYINYVEGIGRYRRIHLTVAGEKSHGVKTILTCTTLDEFENQLPEGAFFRLHRSYIVNLASISSISIENRKYFASLKESLLKLPVSRTKLSTLKSLLQ